MTRYFAWNWNREEIRYVVANATGGNLKIVSAGTESIEQAATIEEPEPGNELEPKTEPLVESSFEDRLEETLKKLVTKLKVSRTETLVAVECGTYELMDFILPPASNNELPELVAHQVSSESIGITEDARIDFLNLAGSEAETRDVIAAVMTAEKFHDVSSLCSAADITPKRFLIRPLATASLFFQQRKEDIVPGSILVNLAGNEADLSLIDTERVLYTRTVHLPEGLSQRERFEKLAIELKRTIASAPLEKLKDESLERIYFLDRDDSEFDQELDRLADRLQLPIENHDPFDELNISTEQIPQQSGLFPALLGMILDESSNRLPAIDFLNPKKSPKPPNRKRLYGIVAAAIVSAILYLGYGHWEKLAEVDAQNSELAKQLKKLKKDFKLAKKKKRNVDALKAWEKKNIVWLDELRELATRFPSQRHLMIHRLSMAASTRSSGGIVTFSGLARDDRMVGRMEDNIRDKFHAINTPKVQKRIQKQALTWHFESTLSVKKRTKKDFLTQKFIKKKSESQKKKNAKTVPVSVPGSKKKTSHKRKTGKSIAGRKNHVE